MIAAAIGAIVGLVTESAWLGLLVFLVLIGLLLLTWHVTKDRISPDRLIGLEVQWHPRNWNPRMVKVRNVALNAEADEPSSYAIVELDGGELKTAPIDELSLPFSARLKYSWRRPVKRRL